MEYNYLGGVERNVRDEHRRRIVEQIRIRRHLRDTSDPFDMSVSEFRSLYRMNQHKLLQLVEVLRPYVRERTSSLSVPLEIKVICAVGFFASGSYQRHHGRSVDASLSQAMVSNCIKEITEVLNYPDILRRYVKFPSTNEEREFVINRNSVLGMPRTLGFIDGTLVKIVPPTDQKQAFYSRKGFTAINVQIVCDADMNILNVNPRLPGSSNDPFIYRCFPVRNAMRHAFEESQCWLLGDSAYPHEPWLQKPLPHAAQGTPEYAYTRLHCHCRNAVERCIGILKARWRCLLCDRTLHYTPVKAGKIVNSCTVLHNYLNEMAEVNPQPIYENLGNDPPEDNEDDNLQIIQMADEVRGYLVRHAFRRRRELHEDD